MQVQGTESLVRDEAMHSLGRYIIEVHRNARLFRLHHLHIRATRITDTAYSTS